MQSDDDESEEDDNDKEELEIGERAHFFPFVHWRIQHELKKKLK